MKCLRKYRWVKLPRDYPDIGKGLLSYWAKLASRAAFRKGKAIYCGHTNPVTPGMWSGGIVGLKSILGVNSRSKALQVIEDLSSMGYLKYSLDKKTKKLSYHILDWVLQCSGAECTSGAVYATQGYGFLCIPRSITQHLVDAGMTFQEADAWLDLWCHTTFEDYGNAFSFLAPIIQYGKFGAVLTLESLGKRWGWEKTKVWRFFRKHKNVFSLQRLSGSYGCLVFNLLYPTGTDVQLPSQESINKIMNEILSCNHYRYPSVICHPGYRLLAQQFLRILPGNSIGITPRHILIQPIQSPFDTGWAVIGSVCIGTQKVHLPLLYQPSCPIFDRRIIFIEQAVHIDLDQSAQFPEAINQFHIIPQIPVTLHVGNDGFITRIHHSFHAGKRTFRVHPHREFHQHVIASIHGRISSCV